MPISKVLAGMILQQIFCFLPILLGQQAKSEMLASSRLFWLLLKERLLSKPEWLQTVRNHDALLLG